MAYPPKKRTTATAARPTDWVALAPLGAVAAFAGLTVLQLPGLLGAWIIMWAASFTAQPPVLTGPKNSRGFPEAAGPGEKAKQQRYEQWRGLRTLLPTPATPGKPLPLVWLVSWPAAVLAYTLPAQFSIEDGWAVSGGWITVLRLVNAFFCYQVVNQVPAAARKASGAPPVNLQAVSRDRLPVVLLAAGVGGWAGWWLAGKGLSGLSQWAWAAQHDLAVQPAMLGRVAAAVVAGLLAVMVMLGEESSAGWKTRQARQQIWGPLWGQLKIDPPPSLVATSSDGDWVFDVFVCPAGATPVVGLADKIRTMHPDGTFIGFQTDSRDPQKLVALICTSRTLPDLGGCDADGARHLLAYGLARVGEQMGTTAIRVGRVEPLDEDGQAWQAQVGGVPWTVLREAWADSLAQACQTDILVDDSDQTPGLLAGVLDQPDDAWRDPATAGRVEWLRYENWWRGVWRETLKQTVNPPTAHHGLHEQRFLNNGQPVWRDGFQIRRGLQFADYLGIDSKLATALQEQFVTVTGHPARPGSGERHPQLVVVIHTKLPPPTIDRLTPATSQPDGSGWVIAGWINRAFDAAKLARPEVIDATCLTRREGAQLWQIGVQLFGGNTLGMVRAATGSLLSALGIPYLRVTRGQSDSQITVVAGGPPENAFFIHGTTPAMLAGLDWEQAWLDAGVASPSKQTPQLAGSTTMPHNDLVTVLDFNLPPDGISLPKIKGAIPKLQGITGNTWIDAAAGPGGPSTLRIMCAKKFPLPDLAPYQVNLATRGVPFATGIDGQVVEWLPDEAPHLLIGGTTGAGKSGFVQTMMAGDIRHNHEIVVIDLSKGAADFQVFMPWVRASATTLPDGLGLIKAVYAEVKRRKDLNAQYGAASYLDLPAEIRPPLLVVFFDEFSDITKQDQPGQSSDDINLEQARKATIAENRQKQLIGTYVSRIAAEARSAGVSLKLSTQLLKADMLDKLPGASDLKINLSRVLLGNPNYGIRQAMLNHPDSTPSVGEILHPGRGVYEPTFGPARLIQTWWSPPAELVAWLQAQNIPAARPFDYSTFVETSGETMTGGGAATMRELWGGAAPDGDVAADDMPADDDVPVVDLFAGMAPPETVEGDVSGELYWD